MRKKIKNISTNTTREELQVCRALQTSPLCHHCQRRGVICPRAEHTFVIPKLYGCHRLDRASTPPPPIMVLHRTGMEKHIPTHTHWISCKSKCTNSFWQQLQRITTCLSDRSLNWLFCCHHCERCRAAHASWHALNAVSLGSMFSLAPVTLHQVLIKD